MKPLLNTLLVTMGVLGIVLPGAIADDGALLGTDGSILRGNLESIDAKGVTWRTKAAVDPVVVPLENIVDLRFPRAPSPEFEGTHEAVISLSRGDILKGRLETLTDSHLGLKTRFGGVLQVRRSMITGVELRPVQKALYSGPNEEDQWKASKQDDAWKLSDGRWKSNRAGARACELPSSERCRLSFDLGWQSSLRFRIMFFSDDGGTTQPDNCYDLVMQRRFIYLRKRWLVENSGGSRILGQFNVPALAQAERARFDLYFDREEGKITIAVNGERVHQFVDPEPATGPAGRWLHLVSEDFYPVEVSGIRLWDWDGQLPPSPMGPERAGAGEMLQLRDGTEVRGELLGIEAGQLKVRTENKEAGYPLAEIHAVMLGGEIEEPARRQGDVRVWARDGSRLTFPLESLEEQTLGGVSQAFGPIKVKIGSLSRIEFNLYNEEVEGLRKP